MNTETDINFACIQYLGGIVMSYKELFSAIECNRIVIIEDDFKQGEYKKERALYDITRMGGR